MKRNHKSSAEATALINELSPEEIKTIQKDYPFRRDREAMIRQLCDRGVTNKTLAEVTGLSDSTISRIRLDKNGDRFSYRSKR